MTTDAYKRKIVQLDVGGTLYKVSRDTIERCEGSMLASLVSDKWKEGNTNEEPIFIDRSGLLFEYVVNYLRTNKVHLPPSVSRAAVKEEFDFYGIDADMTTVYEKYGHKYLQELTTRINIQEASLKMLKAEANAVKASLFVELEFFKQPLSAAIGLVIPEKYVPYDTATLRAYSQLKGLNVNEVRHCVVSVKEIA